MKIGIIGAGSFGLFLAEKLSPFAEVKVYSRSGKGQQWDASLEETAACDWLIPSIPLFAYEKSLAEFAPHVREDTVLVDVCSVKQVPMQLLDALFPINPKVATHPLFGPESAAESLEDHVIVLCAELSDEQAYQRVKEFSQQLKLKVIEMSAKEHDQEMAVVQGLTFFIARALKDMDLHKMKLETPSFKRLRHLAELEANHSDELFKTIQQGNPFTTEVRAAFLQQVKETDKLLGQ